MEGKGSGRQGEEEWTEEMQDLGDSDEEEEEIKWAEWVMPMHPIDSWRMRVQERRISGTHMAEA